MAELLSGSYGAASVADLPVASVTAGDRRGLVDGAGGSVDVGVTGAVDLTRMPGMQVSGRTRPEDVDARAAIVVEEISARFVAQMQALREMGLSEAEIGQIANKVNANVSASVDWMAIARSQPHEPMNGLC